MKPRRILRPKETWARLGCGKTKFEEDYEFHDSADPSITGTDIPRLKPIPLGPRNKGFLEDHLDALIDALAKAGGHLESKAKNAKAAKAAAKAARNAGTGTRVFLTDALPARLERERSEERSELLARRSRLRAQIVGDPDPETKLEIEAVELALRALDQPSRK
jgi:hypothetical protein